MSSHLSSYRRHAADHFEPQDDSDPNAQRRLRGQLEQIDFTAFASNRAVIGVALRQADAQKFQRLALATANARALWIAEALAMTDGALAGLDPRQTARLAELRAAYEELTEAYEGLRRMVERGYLAYQASTPG